jgi:hypothetical protein
MDLFVVGLKGVGIWENLRENTDISFSLRSRDVCHVCVRERERQR